MGFPILGTELELHDLQVGRGTSPPIIAAGVAQCIYQAVSKASPILLEPFMDLEVISLVFLGLMVYVDALSHYGNQTCCLLHFTITSMNMPDNSHKYQHQNDDEC